ncbi:hypothetical protein [Chenggangzhangella methanolivorans]|uniref:Uncharacterized protein n=1 Tax=Chenggangzhangella methanolivorans TaxID=1437009 RepID=A0A9E6R821_9HYPH|nr:hypothetical protein [Chenggangzhangella methanolivorans]QZN98553.1 hypothetical protein K6K41_16075 [Chenggangzhangella methanolivorans]
MRLVLAALALVVAVPAFGQSAPGFTFSGTEVRGPRPGQVVSLRGRVSLEDLTNRLAPLKVQLGNECDGFCVRVTSGNREMLQIFLDERKGAISSIRSYDPEARDVLGNKVGGAFVKAVGDDPVSCDRGESTLCQSKKTRFAGDADVQRALRYRPSRWRL